MERVKVAAQRKLPGVNWDQGLDKPFATVDPGIDELSVLEVLLEVETEFDVDLPEDAINLRVGEQHRRDLKHHLSLSLIAECVKESLQRKKTGD